MLQRAPVLLRVTRDRVSDKWDACDQLNDSPRDDEEIFLYRITEVPSFVFLDYRDKQGRRRGNSSQMARYRFFEKQPTDDVLRSTSLWRKWCDALRAEEAQAAEAK